MNKRKILASAQRHVQRGSLDKALKDYQTILEADPRDANVRLKLGDLQLRRGQPKDAIAAYLNVADQFMRDGFDAKAVAIYKQVTKIDEKRYEIYLPLAELYQRLGLISEAMAALQAAADGYQSEGKRRDALDLLRKMSGLDPSNIPSRLKVADLLAQENLVAEALAEFDEIQAELADQGDRETQASVFERILEVDPNRVASLEALARLHFEQNDYEQAEVVGRRLVAADPELAESNELLAEILIASGQEAVASDFYRAAAEAWRERGDEAKARDLMQRHVSDESIDFGAVASEDGSLEMAGAPGDAELESDFGFEGGETTGIGDLASPDAGFPDLGFDADSASQTSAPPSDPSPAPPQGEGVDLDQLIAEASVYARYGKHERAIETLQSVIARDADHTGALEELGSIYAAVGNASEAVASWERAARLLASADDAARARLLRDRIAALDSEAAVRLGATPSVLPSETASEPTGEEREGVDLELDLSDAILEVGVGEPAAEVVSGQANGDQDETVSGASDLGLEFEIDTSALAVDPDPLEPDEPDSSEASVSPRQVVSPGPAGPSASTSQQIQEELEEANFYFEQRLYDEALPIYQRVLEVAPQHPGALLRLGEIQAATGESPDPGRTLGDAADAGTGEHAIWGAASDGASDADDVLSEPAAPFDNVFAEPPAGPPMPSSTPVPMRPDPTVQTARETDPAREPDTSPDAAPELTVPQFPAADPGDSFDLAAALNEALDDAATSVGDDGGGFETIFSEFKRGVSETLGEGDVETHFDLGIAYREMGLFEDAIGEFRFALASDGRRLDALHMMALCALELDRCQDAVAHLEQALATPDVPLGRELPLRYDLGRAYEAAGDTQRALDSLRRAAQLQPGFQAVEALIAAVERGDALASLGEDEDAEAYESFDDLIDTESVLDPADNAESVAEAESLEVEIADAEDVEPDPGCDETAPTRRFAEDTAPDVHAACAEPLDAEPPEADDAPPSTAPTAGPPTADDAGGGAATSEEADSKPRRRRKVSFV